MATESTSLIRGPTVLVDDSALDFAVLGRGGAAGGVSRPLLSSFVRRWRMGLAAVVACCVLLQLVVSCWLAILGGQHSNINLAVLGFVTIFVIVMLLVALVWTTEHYMMLPLLGISAFSCLLVIFTLVLTIIDHKQKCVDRLSLDGRFSIMFYGIPCEPEFFTLTLVPISLSLVIALVMLGVMVVVYRSGTEALRFDDDDAEDDYGLVDGAGGRSRALLPASSIINSTAAGSGVAKLPAALGGGDGVGFSPRVKAGISVCVGVVGCGLVAVLFCSVAFTKVVGTVPGECPVGNIFFEEPTIADLNCCAWNDGGSCVNPVSMKGLCNHMPNFNDAVVDEADSECDAMLGLLSCAPFNLESGSFLAWNSSANTIGNLRMCASFCADLYAACSDSALFGIPISVLFPTAPEFCEGGLGANVSVSPNGTYGDCFNAGPGRPVPEAWTVLAAVVTVAATLLLSTSSPPATERN